MVLWSSISLASLRASSTGCTVERNVRENTPSKRPPIFCSMLRRTLSRAFRLRSTWRDGRYRPSRIRGAASAEAAGSIATSAAAPAAGASASGWLARAAGSADGDQCEPDSPQRQRLHPARPAACAQATGSSTLKPITARHTSSVARRALRARSGRPAALFGAGQRGAARAAISSAPVTIATRPPAAASAARRRGVGAVAASSTTAGPMPIRVSGDGGQRHQHARAPLAAGPDPEHGQRRVHQRRRPASSSRTRAGRAQAADAVAATGQRQASAATTAASGSVQAGG